MERTIGKRAARMMLTAGFACGLAVVGWTGVASAQSGFYNGKTVDLIIGFNAGDTYDLYSRLAAAHLGQHLPGKPTIVPRNMPGAGSIKAANYIYTQAAKDGTAIGMTGQATAFDQMVKYPGVMYDVRKFNWIGRLTPVIEFAVTWHTVPVKTLEDAMKREVVLAATSPNGVTATAPRLLNRLAGTKFKIVTGYKGVTGTMLAMEQGESEAGTATSQMLIYGRPELLKTPLVSVLVSYSNERGKLFPKIPAMGEFGRTPDEKKILQLYGSTADLGRSLMASPGVPADRVKMLRDAFTAMMKDPGFLADAKKAKMEIDPLDGAGLAKIANDTVNVSPELSAKVAKAIAK